MITLTPAYGRDYKSKAAVLEDWNAAKDFIINDFQSPWDGRPMNKDSNEHGLVAFRFGQLRKVFTMGI